MVKNLTAIQETWVHSLGMILGLGRSPGEGNGNRLPYSCLENSIDRGDWQAIVRGVGHDWLLRRKGLDPRFTS